MKKLLALLLLTILLTVSWVLIDTTHLLPEYGQADLADRVSQKFIQKSVTADQDPIIWGQTDNAETGSANMVTSVVVNYRSFDTLGEVTVLFISAFGISLIAGTADTLIERSESGFILKTASTYLTPVVLLLGIYIITHGHLTPGGGFQGGSMIASAILLMLISKPEFLPSRKKFKVLEGLSGSMYIVLGLLGIVYTGFFLKNFLPTGTVGALFSGGIIPLIYVFIGLKVGSELTGILSDFLKKEVRA